uniref:Uncharacterized protein n=1 Tax=Anguilla anguilla TaxID=7936 RepID=A0A0E9R742_ANGAN
MKDCSHISIAGRSALSTQNTRHSYSSSAERFKRSSTKLELHWLRKKRTQ